ncbi:MAG: hypothetical protein EA422_15315 [Gemmatimonadales bacterium]|nr:MAG: hypothetical protein EA422_15315 [Gemmatimonadales bacterium]
MAVACALVLLVPGCGEGPEAGEDGAAGPGEPPSAEPPPPAGESGFAGAARVDGFPAIPPSLTGDLLLVDGLLRFEPCGPDGPVGDAQPVEDATGGDARQALDELGYGSDRVRVAAVLEGGEIQEIRYAHPEDQRCLDLLPDARLEARGNEPFWNLQTLNGEAVWRTPEELEGLTWFDGAWEPMEGGAARYEARRDGVDGAEFVRLEIVPERCRDSMAGTWHPFSATVRLGGFTWEGCAVEGRRALPAGP